MTRFQWLRSVLFVAGAVCLGGLPTPAAPLKPAPLFPADARLDRRVTVLQPRVYLAELTEQCSRQAGVRLSIDTGHGAVDGIQLTALFEARPLREVMWAAEELFSSPWNRWEWQADASAKGYVLRCQLSPAAAAAAARAELANRWAADLRLAHEVAALPDGKRAARMAARRDLFPATGSSALSGQLDLLRRVDAAELEAMLHGLRKAFDGAGLSVRERSTLSFGLSPGSPIQQPRLEVKWEPPMIAPVLWLTNGDTSTNVIGGPLWDDGWLKTVSGGWTQAGEVLAAEYRNGVVPGAAEPGIPLPNGTLADWLKQAHAKQALSVLADPVSTEGARMGTSRRLGYTPQDTVLAVVVLARMMTRKSGEVHLLRGTTAYLEPRAHLLPWKRIRELREASSRGQGYLDLRQLADLSQETDAQLDGLAEEFPSVSSSVLRQWGPVLDFYRRLTPAMQAEVAKPAGLALRDAGIVARAALLNGADPNRVRALDLLLAYPREARVSLRAETQRRPQRASRPVTPEAQSTPTGGESRRAEEEVRVLIWEVHAPNHPEHTARWVLRPRQPLQPE